MASVKEKNRCLIATSTIVRPGTKLKAEAGTSISDYCIVGEANADQTIFRSLNERWVRLGRDTSIGPWSLIYEGASIGRSCVLGERSHFGSLSTMGTGCRVVYGGQIHDHVRIGNNCVIAGFVADNVAIGNDCHIFGALVHKYAIKNIKQWNTTDETGPTLHNGVFVGWGAVLVGNITIGAGAHIRPNAIVRQSVESGMTYG